MGLYKGLTAFSVAVLVACIADAPTSPASVALDAISGNGVTARQLNAAEIESALFDNTQAPADPFEEEWYGSGVLDVWAALSADWMTVPCLEWQRKEN